MRARALFSRPLSAALEGTEVVIQVMDLNGNVAISYELRRAWVSEYQALPDFDAGATNVVGIQHIKLEHEGWSRDTAVAEPEET